jgi:DNA-binding LytR/AlgR family response regulator
MQLAEALHKLKNPPAVVFVTAYSEYALEAFDVNAVDYLMKPVETDRLNQALDKVQSRVKPQPSRHASVERIPVEKGGRKVLVPIDQIRYIEAKDDYSCIYTDTTATSRPSRLPSSSRSSRRMASSACTAATS